ncbi:hypothetical protein HY971_00915 [Candidatus Kaiserbacteria bacterium]|nr:hypothetical protein [Candidatus Kaiserbacteria bacterium]
MRSFSLREPTLASPMQSVRALSLHRILFRFAFAGVNVYAWIFVFQYFFLIEPDVAHGLVRTALLYALSQTVTCLVTPFAAGLLLSGARRTLIVATVVAASSFIVLGAAFEGFWGGAYIPAALVVFSCGLGLYRALYWIPYEIEVEATGGGRRTRFAEFCIALAPLVGGVFVTAMPFGPISLLFAGAILILIAAIPIFYLRDIQERFAWGYRETFGQLVEPANRGIVVGAVLEGISGAGLLLFWPLAIFTITGWSYETLGLILSLTFVIAILGRPLVRRGLRKVNAPNSMPMNVVLAFTPWVFRMLVGTPLGVIGVDSYFYTTTPRRIGLDPLTFEQAADAGSYVDEYTALKEMALTLGRIFICAIGSICALLFSLPVAFIVIFLFAAVASTAAVLAPR